MAASYSWTVIMLTFTIHPCYTPTKQMLIRLLFWALGCSSYFSLLPQTYSILWPDFTWLPTILFQLWFILVFCHRHLIFCHRHTNKSTNAKSTAFVSLRVQLIFFTYCPKHLVHCGQFSFGYLQYLSSYDSLCSMSFCHRQTESDA